uniref:Reverse transcriptase domain-containing protein n=1 Tax=Anolis carolinensis TaxID=28377 RepID=A0A803TWT5_ANOCA
MIRSFEKVVERDLDILSRTKTHTHVNMTSTEINTIKRLANMPDYIWKQADKGGAIVLLNRKDYINEAMRHLGDQAFYKPLTKDPTNKIRNLIRIVCTEGLSMGYISEKQYDFLQKQNPRIPVFYVLPKIHKGIFPPPGRPIVSGTSSILEPLAQFLDHHLQPFVPLSQSYIKDTKHFINIIETLSIPPQAVLMTSDITSLYTNIPLDEARTVLKELLDTRESSIPPTQFLIDLLDIVLDYNYFRFGSQFYLQTFGVAMESALAPSLANLYITNLEQMWILNSTKNELLHDIIYYGRFIDDIFLVCNTEDTARQLSTWLNTIHNNIKFTSTHSHTSVNFLDITVYKKDNKLLVKNYRKPTDKNSIMHYSSFHHHKLKTNLPFAQLMRLKRNTSTPEDFVAEVSLFRDQFNERGYPTGILNTAIRKVESIDRRNLLKDQVKKHNDRIIWPLTLTQFTPKIHKILKKHWHLIRDIPGCKYLPMIANNRSRNLKDMLISSDLTTSTIKKSNLRGHSNCGHCQCCTQSLRTKHFLHPTLKIHIQLRSFTTCITDQVIYVIQCPCGLLYVGMTSRSLKIRILEHRSRIKNKSSESTLYSHFLEKAHSYTSFTFCALEKITIKPHGDVKRVLLQREAFWISKLQTMHPHGLNDKLDLSCYL